MTLLTRLLRLLWAWLKYKLWPPPQIDASARLRDIDWRHSMALAAFAFELACVPPRQKMFNKNNRGMDRHSPSKFEKLTENAVLLPQRQQSQAGGTHAAPALMTRSAGVAPPSWLSRPAPPVKTVPYVHQEYPKALYLKADPAKAELATDADSEAYLRLRGYVDVSVIQANAEQAQFAKR